MKNFLLTSGLALTTIVANAQTKNLVDFTPSDTGYVQNTIKYSPSMVASTVFEAGVHLVKQTRANDNTKRVVFAPREHDWMWFVPSKDAPNDKGKLVLNHERSVLRTESPLLGEGGSMSVVNVVRDGDKWMIDQTTPMKDTSVSVDFSTVGWTTINCGGAYLPNGLMLTGEEIFDSYRSNDAIKNLHDLAQSMYGYDGKGNYTIPSNVQEFGGKVIPMHQNFGYMTQIDAEKGKAINKQYHMGRFSHESGTVLADGKTMILADDYTSKGGILFKFVADTAFADDKDKYYAGNLFAFKQNTGSYSGTWVAIERNLDSLVIARGVAGRKGATLFARLEWADVDPITGNVYIAETGVNNSNMKLAPDPTKCEFKNAVAMDLGATVPMHWNEPNDSITWNATTGVVDMPYGTLLVLKDATSENPKVEPFIKGGFSSDGKICFASVDGLIVKQIGTKSVIVLQEDLIGFDKGRVAAAFKGTYPYAICEAFLLDLSKSNPTVDDLKLFFAGSRGAEVTGACFTPDAQTMFINNQHPEDSKTNDPKYANSAAIALRMNTTTAIEDILAGKNVLLTVSPNPTSGVVSFNKLVSGSLFNSNGVFVKNLENVISFDLTDLNAGIYFFKSTENEVNKIIVK